MCEMHISSRQNEHLTHWGRVMHIFASWFRQLLVTWPAPRHYLNQCWNIVNWSLRNKRKWNLNQNLYIFIQENPFKNVWKWQPFCLSLNVLICQSHTYTGRTLVCSSLRPQISYYLTGIGHQHAQHWLVTYKSMGYCKKDVTPVH